MNISNKQALKYYKHELETRVDKLKKEISDLSKSIKHDEELMSGYNPELVNLIYDNNFKLEKKQLKLSKILNIIGD